MRDSIGLWKLWRLRMLGVLVLAVIIIFLPGCGILCSFGIGCPELALSTETLRFSVAVKDFAENKTVLIENDGGGTLMWEARAEEDWLEVYPTEGTAPSTINVSVDTNSIKPGKYSGRVSIRATSPGTDSSEDSIAVTLTVTSTDSSNSSAFEVTPSELDFSGPPRGSFASQSIHISTRGTGQMEWSITTNQEWIDFDQAFGRGEAEVEVSVAPREMSPGEYQGQITIESADVGNGTQVVNVHLTILESGEFPVLKVEPTRLTFGGTPGQAVDPKTIQISNTGGGALEWEITTDQSWLTAVPASGTGDANIDIIADTGTFSEGTYAGSLTVSSVGSQNNSVTVVVELQVDDRKVYWAERTGSGSAIRRANLDGSERETLISTANREDPPTELEIDPVRKRIYWIEAGGIRWKDLSGAGVVQDFGEASDAYGMTLDSTNNLLYRSSLRAVFFPIGGIHNSIQQQSSSDFVLSFEQYEPIKESYIARASIEAPSEFDSVFSSGGWRDTAYPEIDIPAQRLFWIDYPEGKVMISTRPLSRSGDAEVGNVIPLPISSSGEGKLIAPETGPCCLAYDSANRILYVADVGEGRIWAVRIIRGGYEVPEEPFVVEGINRPTHLAIDSNGGRLYWVEYGTGKIQGCDLPTPDQPCGGPSGSAIEDVISGLDQPTGLAIEP